MNSGSVGICVLNWNGKDVLSKCLHSIRQLDYPIQKTVVVDNASQDGSRDLVRQQFPEMVLVANERNLGPAGGRNVGLEVLRQADVEFVLLLDNDIVADPAALSHMIALAQTNAQFGILGAKLYVYGQERVLFSTGGILDFTQNVHRNRGTGESDHGQYDKVEEVDCVGAAYMMIRAAVLERVGMFDTDYIGYGFEDTEFCVRARRAGYRVMYCPDAKFWHLHECSASNRRYTFRKKYLESRNAIRFVRENGSLAQRLKFAAFAGLGIPYALVRESVRGNLPGVFGKVYGLVDGLRGREDYARQLSNGQQQ